MEKTKRPTRDDVKLEREMSASLSRITVARKAIIATGKPYGVIPCPVCKEAGKDGDLQFYVARSNGHVHAHCSVDGCVSWME